MLAQCNVPVDQVRMAPESCVTMTQHRLKLTGSGMLLTYCGLAGQVLLPERVTSSVLDPRVKGSH